MNPAQPGQYLTFKLNAQLYGIAIGAVREINRVTGITQLPQAAQFISAVINLRGKLISVVDLRSRLGLNQSESVKQSWIIVINTKTEQVGIIVDSVNGVLDFGAGQIKAPAAQILSNEPSFIIGIGKSGDVDVTLLDIVSALSLEIAASISLQRVA